MQKLWVLNSRRKPPKQTLCKPVCEILQTSAIDEVEDIHMYAKDSFDPKAFRKNLCNG